MHSIPAVISNHGGPKVIVVEIGDVEIHVVVNEVGPEAAHAGDKEVVNGVVKQTAPILSKLWQRIRHIRRTHRVQIPP
jgi:hypothetical protein